MKTCANPNSKVNSSRFLPVLRYPSYLPYLTCNEKHLDIKCWLETILGHPLNQCQTALYTLFSEFQIKISIYVYTKKTYQISSEALVPLCTQLSHHQHRQMNQRNRCQCKFYNKTLITLSVNYV